jgi:hypothetical protein
MKHGSDVSSSSIYLNYIFIRLNYQYILIIFCEFTHFSVFIFLYTEESHLLYDCYNSDGCRKHLVRLSFK